MSPGKRNLKLDVQPEFNFELIGISSHENDYRLVWAINHALHVGFVRMENLQVVVPKTSAELEFSRFIHEDEERFLSYLLVSNRCADGFLFPGIRNIDYLLKVTQEQPDENMAKMLVKTLRGIDIVSGAYSLEPKSLKGIDQIMG